MKIHFVEIAFLALSCGLAMAGSSKSGDVFRPVKIPYSDLFAKGDDDTSGDILLDALSQVGMVSVTNMPEDFRQAKRDTLAWTNPCGDVSAAMKEHTFADGTRRRTMATHTIPGGIQTIDHGSSPRCDAFSQASAKFRQGVDKTTRAFASRVSGLLNQEMPLLETEQGYPFQTVADVVENGEHLEHFHSYNKTNADPEAPSTVEWHTDQGLMLVFTPGMMTTTASEGVRSRSNLLGETEGFFVELADGTHAVVDLGPEDDLVIMLGDGVNQYVNENVKDNKGRKLRACPHALTVPDHDPQNAARVWYGRMVLPPASAIHPEHGKTFGHLRQLLIDSSSPSSETNEDLLALGCSSSSSFTHSRQLEESSCEEGTLYCWHRCMSLEVAGVSEEICAEQNLDLYCINPRGQKTDFSHGDWFPGCIDLETAPNATAYPKLPDYPRDEEECTDAGYESFVASYKDEYDFMADLMEGGTLMWSVVDDKVKGMFSYNGIFGFTSLGFAGYPGGNAMHGAIVITATPSEMYSPVTGFNYSYDPLVADYIIHDTDKAFRWWQTPVAGGTDVSGELTSTVARSAAAVSDTASYGIVETDCYTAMTFFTAGIYNTTFNTTGTDKLIWGANGEDMFAGYHGMSRGVIEVDWKGGTVTLDEKREALKAETAAGETGEADAGEAEAGEAEAVDPNSDASQGEPAPSSATTARKLTQAALLIPLVAANVIASIVSM
ncbi:expressed unknown protein [Seminavis robusta]|uniref:Uncharacterized protein n=1 Tax=Seminavis robusta TaxID=568900 RepID=A0A9N8H191_9STRA|nr:expressed unknown protein [Seminavis robusta]|eukprot:Sro35_g022560.1 n/a (721) ;mRNA; f:128192-130444